MMAKIILELKDVTREFTQGSDTIYGLRKTSFSAKPGEFIAIIGPSGSGKSTFLTVAGGLRNPTSGQVKIDGKDITNLTVKQLSKIRLTKVGFILQASNLVPFLTVEKQLTLLDKVTKRNPSKHSLNKLFKDLGIESLRQKYPSELSGGERQRVAIAKVLYGNSKLILADEPTASLDTKKAFDVVKLLADETKERGKATIMVTHDRRLVKFCDKVYYMRDGALSRTEAK